MSVNPCSFAANRALRLIILGLLVSALATAGVVTCPAVGTRNGGPPSTATNPADWNPNYIPSGNPGFGVSGPTDLDDGSTGDADKADDACLTFVFNVPSTDLNNKTDSPFGWGGLTLSFDKPIDGGSFIFDPVCPTPVDGTLGQVLDSLGEPLVGLNQSITFKPTLGGRAYYALPTDTPVGKPRYSAIDYSDTQAPNFSQFAVTIMFDASQGVPTLLSDNGRGDPESFWVGKPSKQNGGFTPYRGASGPGMVGVDFQLVPEPSSLALLLCGYAGLLVFQIKRLRSRRR